MTSKQLSKLETRIATLKQANRIVWIEGIDAAVIKGKIAGKPRYFVKADSLNENGGSWYYIIRWESIEWVCSCESVQPCKHCRTVGARVNAQFLAKVAEAEQAQAEEDARYRAEKAQRDAEAYERRLAFVAAFDPCLVA